MIFKDKIKMEHKKKIKTIYNLVETRIMQMDDFALEFKHIDSEIRRNSVSRSEELV